MVTDNQVLALWKEFRKTKVIKIAALKTGMDRKTASKYLKQNTLPSESIKDRQWRTRPDNFEDDVDVAIDLILSDSDLTLSSELIAELVIAEKESIIDSIELIPNLNIYDSLFLNKGDENHENCYQ